MNSPHNSEQVERFAKYGAVVLSLSGEMNEKLVPAPTKESVLHDLLCALKRFKSSVRWQYFWIMRKELSKKEKEKFSAWMETENDKEDNDLGLNTGLRDSTTTRMGPALDSNVEAFILDVQKTLLQQLEEAEPKPGTKRARDIRNLEKEMKDLEAVVVPTNKMNSFLPVALGEYKEMVLKHLEKRATEISFERLSSMHSESLKILEKYGKIMSKGEQAFVKALLTSKAIPIPKLLVKDHKKKLTKIFQRD